MADYQVTFRIPGVPPKKVRAAYVTTEDKHPDKLAFKDYENRTVSLISRDDALTVDRMDPGAAAPGSVTVNVHGFAGDEKRLASEVMEAVRKEALRGQGDAGLRFTA